MFACTCLPHRSVWTQLWAQGSEVAKPGGAFSAVYIVLSGGFSESTPTTAATPEAEGPGGGELTEEEDVAAALKPVGVSRLQSASHPSSFRLLTAVSEHVLFGVCCSSPPPSSVLETPSATG